MHAAAAYPKRLSVIEASAIWMPYMTTYGALIEYGKLAAGEHIVITAASSSLGIAAIQMAKALGAVPIAVTRGADKRDFIAAQQPAHVVVSSEEDLATRILDITHGRGAEMVFDPSNQLDVNFDENQFQNRFFHPELFYTLLRTMTNQIA